MLHHLKIDKYTNFGGTTQDIPLSYQVFGPELHTAPIVLVNHALTGNSDVAGENGWWSALIGDGKCIDTKKYTIIVFNVPGNGYDGFLIENYKDFVAQDIAKIFLLGLEALKIHQLFALIGGSMGGGIAWEMVALKPNLTENLIPVASDWKSTDWLIANSEIQELLDDAQGRLIRRRTRFLNVRPHEARRFRGQTQRRYRNCGAARIYIDGLIGQR